MYGYKKAGRFPMRVHEGPTKNPIQRRQRNVQQGIRIQCSCWYFELWIKRGFLNLVGFRALLIEIRLK